MHLKAMVADKSIWKPLFPRETQVFLQITWMETWGFLNNLDGNLDFQYHDQ